MPEIKVGRWWTRNGGAAIVARSSENMWEGFTSEGHISWFTSGCWRRDAAPHPWDLVEYLGPLEEENSKPEPTLVPQGISRRDYFAAMAMHGILIHSASNWPIDKTPESLCGCAVQTADALITELDREGK